ncbi:MAG: hypothetical protein Q7S33_02855 [Nanoarchaeota archaeon]|nr:hypothetical protein [Nanoarchaeota archaeon]
MENKEDYGHFIDQYLFYANSDNTIVHEGFLEKAGLTLEKCLKRINSNKFFFRTNLNLLMITNHNVNLPSGLDLKLNEIYERADFDWGDYKEFKNFIGWYVENIHNPYFENTSRNIDE